MINIRKTLLAAIILSLTNTLSYCGDTVNIYPQPVGIAYNLAKTYSLTNSVDFHPHDNIFCVTFTHTNNVTLYKLLPNGKPKVFQNLCNPLSELSEPQHAVFSPDGELLLVANWTNQTLTIYSRNKEGLFLPAPAAVICPPSVLKHHKPHGVAFSPDGQYLAIAYRAGYNHQLGLVEKTD